MSRPDLAAALSASLSLGVSLPAFAGLCRAESTIAGAGHPTAKASMLMIDPVLANALSAYDDSDPAGTLRRSSDVSATSGGGSALGTVRARSNGAWIQGDANASVVADDVIVRRRDGAGDGETVVITANIAMSMSPTLSMVGPVPYGNTTTAQMTWRYAISGTGGWVLSGRSAQQGVSGISPLGAFGDPMQANFSVTFQVVSGSPFSIRLESLVSCQAAGEIDSLSVDIQASGSMRLGMPDASFAPGGSRMAFLLPDGYTADSATLGIVDNMIAPIPGPGGAALLGTALAVARRRRR